MADYLDGSSPLRPSSMLAQVLHGGGGRRACLLQDALIEQAFTYAFPVYEMMRVRWAYVEDPRNPGSTSVNQIAHGRTLIDHTRRVVTTPNNDTLYSRTILDLSAGPVGIHVPDTNGRYYSLALYDIYSNGFAYIGRRLTGTREGDFVVVSRILVDGEADLAAARAVQDGVRVAPLGAGASARPRGIAPLAGDAANFVEIANQALRLNGAPAYEKPLLKRFAAVGICGAECSWDVLSEAVQARWRERFPALMASLKQPLAGNAVKPVNGWYYNPPQIGNFGTDWGYRAVVALNALLAMEPAEAVYPLAETDDQGSPLSGEHRYQLRLPAGGVPVDAFCSLSMYELMSDGRLFFSDNPIRRCAIGDRTKGLARNADGSIDLWLQHDSPGRELEANWLPAPAGQFKLVLRGDQPRVELLESRFRVPGIERVD
jgi:hypothetical protein